MIPQFGRHRLDAITTFDLQRYRKLRRNAGVSDATVNREFATFLHMMNRAVEWKWLKAERKPRMPRVAEYRKPRRALTPSQAQALYEGALADHDPRLWLFVLIGLGTGMRHSEILSRRYDEIDWQRSRFEIGKAKAGARLQPFPASVRSGLLKQRAMEADQDGWIFPATRQDCKRPHRTALDDGFRRAANRAGLDPKKVTPHLMRHTLVTNLSETTDVATIQKISGHKTAAMVMHYTHVNDERVDNALSAMEALSLSGITPKLHSASATTPRASARVESINAGKTAA